MQSGNGTAPDGRIVTVFGSARAQSGSPGYAAAMNLGAALARAGFAVCNGGFDGVMEASARGAKEAGGRTIGVTVGIFPARIANQWLDEEIQSQTLFLRLERLTSLANAFIVLHGGVGTLVELALVWNLSQAGALEGKPIVVVGAEWRQVIESIGRHLAVKPADFDLLHFVDEPLDAVAWLRERLTASPAIADAVASGESSH
ncbi:MAG: LOG family protein [Chloroflexi bacterium]|nr:LOG family protein [Chloroflexota bacterium]